MMMRVGRVFLSLLTLGVFAVLSAACGAGQSQASGVDATFENFYRSLGGQERLGNALSPMFQQDGIFYQYTAAVVMAYNPQAPSTQRYFLYAAGSMLGISDPAEPLPAEPTNYYRNGHIVWEEVVPMYDSLGWNIVGLPLSSVRYNPTYNRYEQYFENMGFYRFKDEPAGSIHFLAYGAWLCAEKCVYNSIQDMVGTRTMPLQPADETLRVADTAFAAVAARMGQALTGDPLSMTRMARDGKIEKVFGNLVLAAEVQTPDRPQFRPLSEGLGYRATPPQPNRNDPNLYFYPLEGDLGYHIPAYFWEYIATHGGIEIFGMPISEEERLNDAVSRQCFTNLCLEMHQRAPAALRVRPAPLGYTYYELYPDAMPTGTVSTTTPSAVVSMQVWEKYNLLPNQEAQEIYVVVSDNNVGIPDQNLTLTLTMPDGKQSTYNLLPTDANGQSSLRLEPISASNGTLVPYQVCLTGDTPVKFCVRDGFVIWDTP